MWHFDQQSTRGMVDDNLWRLRTKVDGRKPNSVHDSEVGATSKTLSRGVFYGSPRAPGVFATIFNSPMFLLFVRLLYTCFPVVCRDGGSFDLFVQLFAALLGDLKFTIVLRLERKKGETAPTSTVPASTACVSTRTCRRDETIFLFH